jgi:hypothetical protein
LFSSFIGKVLKGPLKYNCMNYKPYQLLASGINKFCGYGGGSGYES